MGSVDAYSPSMVRQGDMHVCFKGKEAQLGDIRFYPGETPEAKIAASFRREGVACFQKLQHNYILYLQDDRTGESFLVRDHFGVEPLFFKVFDFKIVFSQSLAELRTNESVNRHKVADYLLETTAGEEAPEAGTFFEGLYSVPPGCFVHASPAGFVRCAAYWRPRPVDISGKKDNSLVEEFRARLFDSVAFTTQDMSGVAAHLSGGLDSSVITLAYREIKKATFPTYFFSVGTEGKRDLYYAGLVAAKTGCPHYGILPNPDTYSCLYNLSKTAQAPEVFMLPSSIHYAVSEMALKVGCEAILTGHDGDSVVGHGYRYLREMRNDNMEAFMQYCIELRGFGLSREEAGKRITQREIMREFRSGNFRRVRHILQVARKTFGYVPLEFLKYLAQRMIQRFSGQTSGMEMRYLLHKDLPVTADPVHVAHDLYEYSDHEIVENFKAAVNADFDAQFQQFYALEQDLGVRYLHPFFDKDLFELCLAIPNAMRFGKGKTRWLMRDAMKDLLPPELYLRQDKDDFSEYLVETCLSLWLDNRERFEENRELWRYIDVSQFRKRMDFLVKRPNREQESRGLARKLNRVMYLGIWLDAIQA